METTGTGSSEHPRKGRGSAPRPTLIELAHHALEESDGDETAATIILRDYVLEDVAYVDEICALIIHRVAMDDRGTSEKTSRHRASTTAHTRETKTPDPDSVAALASVVGRSLLDFKLPNGMPALREATAEDIDEAVVRYRKQAHTMNVRVKWLQAIKALLQPGQTVGEAVDELTARKLYEEADGD